MTPQKCIEWNIAFSVVGKIIQSAFWTKIIDENQNFLWGRMRNCISWTSARCVWKIGRTNLAAQIRKSFSLLWKTRLNTIQPISAILCPAAFYSINTSIRSNPWLLSGLLLFWCELLFRPKLLFTKSNTCVTFYKNVWKRLRQRCRSATTKLIALKKVNVRLLDTLVHTVIGGAGKLQVRFPSKWKLRLYLEPCLECKNSDRSHGKFLCSSSASSVLFSMVDLQSLTFFSSAM